MPNPNLVCLNPNKKKYFSYISFYYFLALTSLGISVLRQLSFVSPEYSV